MVNVPEQRAIDELRSRAAGGTVNPVQFLRHYWQKKPLLVRQAFPHFTDPVTANELAGLACENEVESRLVMERGGAKPWQVLPGPQQAARLRRLPRSHWTLLVQGVDRFIPGAAALLESFRFIPDWRVDDVMVSFAPRGGTVGPHIDSYDVFLLQGKGRRRWRIDSKAPTELRPGLDLRVLRHFRAEKDWILEPGDMLYLPPDLAHFGVALEDCLTYSIGFRSPSAMDLLAATQERLMHGDAPAERYRDPGLHLPRWRGEIPREAVRDLRRVLERSLRQLGASDFDRMVGEILTEPKGSIETQDHRLSAAQVRSRLQKGHGLARIPGCRMGFISKRNAADLFVNGRRWALSSPLMFAAPLLTDARYLSGDVLRPHLKKKGFLALLADLVGAGAFQWEK